MNDELSYYKYLCSIMITTKGARFTEASRLIRAERFSVITLAILSIFLISVSVALLTDPDAFDAKGTKFFGALSVIASVWILSITLYDYALERNIIAHKLHRNALIITKILRELERELAKNSPDFDIMRRLAKEYEDQILETEVNHSSGSYRLYNMQRRQSKCKFVSMFYAIQTNIYSFFLFIFSVPSNILVLFIISGGISWYFFIR